LTPDDFRAAALALTGASEGSHSNHPDFRVNGKVFASLGYPDAAWGVVMLTPGEQHTFTQTHPRTFTPLNNSWGAKGATWVRLATADPAAVDEALAAAWRPRATAQSPKRSASRGSGRSR
jgi:hypothetical protein